MPQTSQTPQLARDPHPGPATIAHGQTVRCRLDGRPVGEIVALATQPETGRIAYALLSRRGWLMFRSRHWLVPWDLLTFDSRAGEYVTSVTQEDLKLAPETQAGQAGWSDEAERAALYRFYRPLGAHPYWRGCNCGPQGASPTRSPQGDGIDASADTPV